jgi:pyridoxal phosphate enzyme (YggS family)
MPVNTQFYNELRSFLEAKNVLLVAVSKTKPVEDILALYELGQRDFGENYVQELLEKKPQLPSDIRWHFIGHLQSNKVKFIAPFVHLIHGVDSQSLLKEISRQGQKHDRKIDALLQVHIAEEETKFGLSSEELGEMRSFIRQNDSLRHIQVVGLMGMATFTNDELLVRREFGALRSAMDQWNLVMAEDKQLSVLSMGMSGDYQLAIQEGSNLVRIGSLLFGNRV